MSKKIEIIYQENANCAFIYNVNDWEVLRKTYRITGEIFGHAQFTPAFPLRLNPEEVVLLVKNSIAKLIKYGNIDSSSTEYENFKKELLQEEEIIYANLRKEEVKNSTEKIVAGKRKRGDQRPEEVILQEELQKQSKITEDKLIWPILTTPFGNRNGSPIEVPLELICKHTTKTKCLVYEDLWKRGFYITPGQKFGADFLVYSGDPILFHAVYIVRCIEDPAKAVHSSELIAFGRLGTSVKKKAVLASLNANSSIAYITLNWVESTR